MKRLLMALLLCLTVLNAIAQKTASDEVKRLQARMYKLYSGYDYDEFIMQRRLATIVCSIVPGLTKCSSPVIVSVAAGPCR